MFTRTLFLSLTVLLTACAASFAQTTSPATDSTAQLVGKWTGTFDGASSGSFELVINQDASRKLTGQITINNSNGNRQVTNLKTVSWQNGQLTITYDDPQDGDEVSLKGTYADPNLKGTWQADDSQATGTWQLARAAR